AGPDRTPTRSHHTGEPVVPSSWRATTQADAARKWGVDTSVVIKLRRDAKDAAMAAFASSRPGGSRDPRDVEIEMLKAEIARLSEAIKEQAIELALIRGKSRWA
ncbi:MAG: hypothetical protein P1T08_18815, partial [Acidimicrobiia bacterium]|nr:hypothetical protein [Acidimicrobiia bacterium]